MQRWRSCSTDLAMRLRWRQRAHVSPVGAGESRSNPGKDAETYGAASAAEGEKRLPRVPTAVANDVEATLAKGDNARGPRGDRAGFRRRDCRIDAVAGCAGPRQASALPSVTQSSARGAGEPGCAESGR